MDFVRIPPPEYLREHVRYYWTLESGANLPTSTFSLIADGCPGIIYQPKAAGVLDHAKADALPPLILTGQTTKHASITLHGRFQTIGVYFHPFAIGSLFGLNAAEFNDSCLDITELELGKTLLDELDHAGHTGGRLEIFNRFLFKHLSGKKPTDWMIKFSTETIEAAGGDINLRELCEALDTSERTLERKFKQNVGVSPKTFSRIIRFQNTLARLRSCRGRLTDVATDFSYADQSHFIRNFREFSGITPKEFRANFERIGSNLGQNQAP